MGTVKAPTGELTVLRTSPVPTLMIAIEMPGITAWLESVTEPLMLPRLVWPRADAAARRTRVNFKILTFLKRARSLDDIRWRGRGWTLIPATWQASLA